MEGMTAAQAAEAAKDLTFEKVWAALQESAKETRQILHEAQLESQKQYERTQKQIDKTQRMMRDSKKRIDDLSNNVGGVNNKLGLFTESLFSTGLEDIFNEVGYQFTKQSPHTKFKDKPRGKTLAEVDYFLEDGEYAMAVEIKMELKTPDVDDHLDRIAIIRRYFDERGDKRILVGAVAGGIIRDSVMKYAQKWGLYVVMQKGESTVIADMPKGFKAREW